MVRELKNRLFLILLLAVIVVVSTGCSSFGTNNPKYYTGYNSVEMSFLQDSPPSIFYYDGQAPYGSDINTLPIHVQITNQGSSDAYGALFIQGLDPGIFSIQGYTQGYPGYTGLGRWSQTMFSGYFDPNGNLAVSGFNIPINGKSVSLSLANIGGQKSISFSSFGYGNRSGLFNNLGFTVENSKYTGYTGVSVGVINSRVGSILTPITRGMFSTYGWGNWLKEFELEGRNPNNPAGGMDMVEFPTTMIALPTSLEEFPLRIMVTSCFDYATHASTMVCLDPEPYSNVKKACQPVTASPGGGQGAPVAVTTIEQRPGKGRTTFVINIHHNRQSVDDELYDYFSLYKCDPASGQTVKTTDTNVVYIGYVYLSNIDITMSCIPDQVMRLDASGNGQITCSITFPPGMASAAYKADLELELWYGYSKTIYKDIVVRRLS